MKKRLFEELLASVREGAAILGGKRAPSRIFHLEPPEIEVARTARESSEAKVSLLASSVGGRLKG